jgi:phospholipase/carboxylesterase
MQKLEQIGELTCRVVQDIDENQTPKLAVVICHGYGASGTDLLDLATFFMRADPRIADNVQFFVPEAPLSLASIGMPNGRAWWHLDVERLIRAAELGEFRNLRDDHPDGLPEAREQLQHVIDHIQATTGLPMSKIVLAGFSQGSMLCIDIALRSEKPPAALVVWSGTLLCESTWRELAAKRGKLKVLQSHGHTDQILPFEASGWLRDLFETSGFDVEFIEFPGVHTVPMEALQQTAQLLIELLGETDAASDD